MQKKWVIIGVIVIVLALIAVAASNALRYDGDISTKVETENKDKDNVNKVELDYSLRLKKTESYTFKVEKEKVLKIDYKFESVDNAIKVTIKDKENDQEIHSFFVSEDKGMEEVNLPKGEYTMNFIIPSLSKGSASISWK